MEAGPEEKTIWGHPKRFLAGAEIMEINMMQRKIC